MTTLLIAEFNEDRVVVHFGGQTNSIDAQTYALALLGFTATAKAVNAVINPGQEIEIWVEADGSGSYRTWVRKVHKGLGGFFSEGYKAVFWGIIGTLIYDHFIKNEPNIQVQINTDEVIIARGTDRVVIAQNAKKDLEVQKGLERTFAPLEANPSVTDFGLTQSMSDAKPSIQIPRESFQLYIRQPGLISAAPESERIRSETARVLIIKAWLNHKKRKWAFEWNGVPISAPIADEAFLDKIAARKYLIGHGDALDVEITFKQTFNTRLGVYQNDEQSFVIAKVIDVIPND
jgi:hypothetical protein